MLETGDRMFLKKKKNTVPDLWNFMTSLNKKDKTLFESLPNLQSKCNGCQKKESDS